MKNNSPQDIRKNEEKQLVLELQDVMSSIQLNLGKAAAFLKNELHYLANNHSNTFTITDSGDGEITLNVGEFETNKVSCVLVLKETYNIKIKIRIAEDYKIYTLKERDNSLPGYQLDTDNKDIFKLKGTVINHEFKTTLINLFIDKLKEWSSTSNNFSSFVR